MNCGFNSHLNDNSQQSFIFLCLCGLISVCFDLVLIPVEKFLQKRAPSTALQNSKSTSHIFEEFQPKSSIKTKLKCSPYFQFFSTSSPSEKSSHFAQIIFPSLFPNCRYSDSISLFNYLSPQGLEQRTLKTLVEAMQYEMWQRKF